MSADTMVLNQVVTKIWCSKKGANSLEKLQGSIPATSYFSRNYQTYQGDSAGYGRKNDHSHLKKVNTIHRFTNRNCKITDRLYVM